VNKDHDTSIATMQLRDVLAHLAFHAVSYADETSVNRLLSSLETIFGDEPRAVALIVPSAPTSIRKGSPATRPWNRETFRCGLRQLSGYDLRRDQEGYIDDVHCTEENVNQWL
jgi:hypothetical protein